MSDTTQPDSVIVSSTPTGTVDVTLADGVYRVPAALVAHLDIERIAPAIASSTYKEFMTAVHESRVAAHLNDVQAAIIGGHFRALQEGRL